MRPWLLCALLVALARPAAADVADLLGRRVTGVRLEADGGPVLDRNVLSLVETRLGERLAMADVRQTIDHFVTLGRYVDIRVYAEPDGAEGVRVRYGLVTVARVTRLAFRRLAGVDERVLRTELADRFGAEPTAGRLPEMAAAVTERLRTAGFPGARVEAQTAADGAPGRVAATFVATPGRQTVVGAVTADGPPAVTRDLIGRLGLVTGRPLSRTTLDERTRAAEDDIKAGGYYEALISVAAGAERDGVADVAVRVDLGDRVEVDFTGDPVPQDRRRTLVPIEGARSVEEEVIEDASRNLEQYLRLEGYRTASAPATRRRADGRLRITFDVKRGPLYVLESLTLDGVAGLPRADLQPLLKLEVGEAFVDERVGAVAAALAEYYRVRGFATVRVAPVLTVPPLTPGAETMPVDVQLAVTEGARVMVADVRFEGFAALTPPEAAAAIGLTAGKPYYRPQQVLDRDTLERRYRNLGYQRASVEIRAEPVAGASDVRLIYAVREGAQTVVDHILVSGTIRISPDLIRREITLQPGRPLGYDALLESQQRLSTLGLFRRVRITEAPHGGTDNRRDVLIDVEEAPSTGVSYGGGLEMGLFARRDSSGVATDRFNVAPRGFFEVTRRNLWGKNRSLSLLTSVSLRPTDPGVEAAPTEEGGYGLNQYRVIGTFREPRAFDSAGDAQVSAFVERGIRLSFNFDRQGVRAEYARRFQNRVTVLGRYSYDFTQLFDTKIAVADRLLVDRLFPQVRLSSLFGSVLRDSRNDVLDPDRGTVLGADLEVDPRQLGSQVGFVKTFGQAFAYRRLPGGRPFVLAGGVRLGLARGFARRIPRVDGNGRPVLDASGAQVVDVVDDLPAAERFFAGGDTTVRGFSLDRLGSDATLNADGFPSGGNGLVVLNLELRTPHVKGVGLVTFVDTGNVFAKVSDMMVSDLRTTAGFGFRYRSPLGPLRFDIGFKLDSRDIVRGSQRRVYHLSLGQAF